MIEDTIAKIEAKLGSAESLSEEKRRELAELLEALRAEVRSLPEKVQRQAVDEVDEEDEDVQSTVQKLEEALAGFERSHPQLITLVNRISTILSNMGI
jgi:uncharacterized coiled-coil DUF342 family protein